MNSKEFSKIRHFLGRTQKQQADLLCVSAKAIQSYEQGWRRIPVHLERQMLILLSLKLSSVRITRPCWQIKKCPRDGRDNCIAWELKLKDFCWFLTGTFCEGKTQNNWEEKIKLCRKCEVYRLMFSDI